MQLTTKPISSAVTPVNVTYLCWADLSAWREDCFSVEREKKKTGATRNIYLNVSFRAWCYIIVGLFFLIPSLTSHWFSDTDLQPCTTRQNPDVWRNEPVGLQLDLQNWNYPVITVNWICQLQSIIFCTAINQGHGVISHLTPDIALIKAWWRWSHADWRDATRASCDGHTAHLSQN